MMIVPDSPEGWKCPFSRTVKNASGRETKDFSNGLKRSPHFFEEGAPEKGGSKEGRSMEIDPYLGRLEDKKGTS